MTQQKYVVGFYYGPERNQVWLIYKDHPEWQKGKLNGIGGHVEKDETALEAMYREWIEETGCGVAPWENFLVILNSEVCVYFFRAFATNNQLFSRPRTQTSEQLFRAYLCDFDELPVINNLHWIVPLGLDRDMQVPIITSFKENAEAPTKQKEQDG